MWHVIGQLNVIVVFDRKTIVYISVGILIIYSSIKEQYTPHRANFWVSVQMTRKLLVQHALNLILPVDAVDPGNSDDLKESDHHEREVSGEVIEQVH